MAKPNCITTTCFVINDGKVMFIKQVCLEKKILDKKTLDRILDPRREFGNV